MNPKFKITQFIKKYSLHLSFLLVLCFILCIIGYKLLTWGTIVKSDFDPNNIQGGDDYVEVLDSIVPLLINGEEVSNADGQTTIVTFGNAPFADEKGQDNNLARIIEKKTGATVYNCAISGSYATNSSANLQRSHPHMDAFTFYWLTTLFCVGNQKIYDNEFEKMDKQSEEYFICKEAIDTINSIDFMNVDVIAIMYDATDFYKGHLEYDGVSMQNIQSFGGNIYSGIDLIQKTYPHIRIIVLSPTYAYSLDNNNEYLDSELVYNYIPLSSYFSIVERAAYLSSVSFVDNFYGSINALNAKDFLMNHYQLNDEGRELIADRFIYALNYFN